MTDVSNDILGDAINKIESLKHKSNLCDGDFIDIWANNIAIALYKVHTSILSNAKICNDNDRVYYGILTSNYKKIEQMRRLVCKNESHTDILGFYNRTIAENCIMLRYLLKHKEYVRRFQLSGLKHLKYYTDEIISNIDTRGVTEWDEGLLKSIKEEYDKIHTSDAEVNEAKKLGSIENISKDLSAIEIYNICYREMSIFMHCNWEYISKNIFKDPDELNLELKEIVRLQQLNPILLYAVKTDIEFVDTNKIEGYIDRLKSIFIIAYLLDVIHHFTNYGKSILGINVDLAIEEYINNDKIIYRYE